MNRSTYITDPALIAQATEELNIHPNWRWLNLREIRALKCMIRENRYVPDCRAIRRETLEGCARARAKIQARAREIAQRAS